jgi:hypothetical protein
MSIQVLTAPSQNVFADLVASAKEDIFLAAPYVKANIASLILDCRQSSAALSLLTAYRLPDFHRRASDVGALKTLLDAKASVRSCQTLHAKVYIFDSARAIVTSANLTTGGLSRNIECGVLLDDRSMVADLRKTFCALFTDKENSWAITGEILETTESILAKVPSERRPKFEMTDRELLALGEEPTTALYDGGIDSIRSTLSGWRLDTFDVAAAIPSPVFQLADIYAKSADLAALHPENRNIEPKIRQQLQLLRDMGLIEFMGNGVYRKLWIDVA